MHFIDASIDKTAFVDFEKLYIESFPKDERFELSFLRERAMRGDSKLFSIYENLADKTEEKTQSTFSHTEIKHPSCFTEFIGLINLIFHSDIVFIFYFAINAKLRGGGRGSQILKELGQKYGGKRICLCIEILGEQFENNNERVRRKNFYLKNGFVECGYSFLERGLRFEMLGSKIVSRGEFEALLINYFGAESFAKYYEF